MVGVPGWRQRQTSVACNMRRLGCKTGQRAKLIQRTRSRQRARAHRRTMVCVELGAVQERRGLLVLHGNNWRSPRHRVRVWDPGGVCRSTNSGLSAERADRDDGRAASRHSIRHRGLLDVGPGCPRVVGEMPTSEDTWFLSPLKQQHPSSSPTRHAAGLCWPRRTPPRTPPRSVKVSSFRANLDHPLLCCCSAGRS